MQIPITQLNEEDYKPYDTAPPKKGKSVVGKDYDELKAYCDVLENENDLLEEKIDKLELEGEKKDLMFNSLYKTNSEMAMQLRERTERIEEKDREIEKLRKIIRAVEVIMGGKILDD